MTMTTGTLSTRCSPTVSVVGQPLARLTTRDRRKPIDFIDGEPWYGPVRQVGHAIRTFSGKVPSWKSGRMVSWEGFTERDHVLVWELDYRVIRIFDQPFCVPYAFNINNPGMVRLSDDGGELMQERGWRRTHYTPDYLVQWRDRYCLYEVKHSSVLQEERTHRAVAVAALFAAQRGWDFELSTEAIRAGHRVANAKLLLRHRVQDVSQHWCALAQSRVAETPGVTVRQLMAATQQTPATAWAWCCYLVSMGWVACDLDLPFTVSTQLCPLEELP